VALYKRGDTYYVKLTGPSGETIRRSTGTKNRREAQEYHDRLKAEIWKAKRLNLKPPRTWDEGIYRWALERQHLPGFVNYRHQIAWWTQHLRGKYLHEITRDLVDELITTKLSHLSNSTKDHYLKPVRGMLNCAKNEWGWIDSVPKFRKYTAKGEDERMRWLTPQQWWTLFSELPRHTRYIALFSLATGLRRGNVLRLRKADVDWTRRVAYIGQVHNRTKNKKPLTVPLNRIALMVLRAVWEDHPEYVFTYKGKPVKQVNTKAWKKALKRAGIEDFRWHDLRHTWATWMKAKRVDSLTLMKLVGWQSLEMVKRYEHVDVDHLFADAAQMDTLLDTPQIKGFLGQEVSV